MHDSLCLDLLIEDNWVIKTLYIVTEETGYVTILCLVNFATFDTARCRGLLYYVMECTVGQNKILPFCPSTQLIDPSPVFPGGGGPIDFKALANKIKILVFFI